jgi:hypothetical protein
MKHEHSHSPEAARRRRSEARIAALAHAIAGVIFASAGFTPPGGTPDFSSVGTHRKENPKKLKKVSLTPCARRKSLVTFQP